MARRKRLTEQQEALTKSVNLPKAPREVVAEALQTTFWLQGNIKSTRMASLRIAKKVASVRDKKLYQALGHVDIQSYAWQRLHLGKSSLSQYLRIFDWAKSRHPQWLDDKPKGFIPDLSDVGDLMWIEDELDRTCQRAVKTSQGWALENQPL